MRNILLFILAVLCLSNTSYSYDSIYINIAINDKNYKQIILKDNHNVNNLKFRSLRLAEDTFNINTFKSEFYQINIKKNIKIFNKKISYFEISPVMNDRFKHILWLYKNNIIVRHEIYDLKNSLLYSSGYLNNFPEHKKKIINITKKSKNTNNELDRYKGFFLIYESTLDNYIKHMLYSDGLNRFSLFVKKVYDENTDYQKIMFGNYVLSKKYRDKLYIIIGTIPYEQMQGFLKQYISKKEEINEN